MSGLPWYAWINLLGLVLLWGLYWIGHWLQKTRKVLRMINYLSVLTAGVFVVTHFNGSMGTQSNIVVQALAVFLIAMTAWEFLSTIYVMVTGPETQSTIDDGGSVADAPTPGVPDDDGVLDLDAGTVYSSENQEKMTKAIGKLAGPGSTGQERLEGIGTLLSLGSEDDGDEDEGGYLYELATLGFMMAVLLPPCYFALQVF